MLKRPVSRQLGRWTAGLALVMGMSPYLVAVEPKVTAGRPAPVSLPAGWFSPGAGNIQLVAHEPSPSPLPSSRRNAAERLEFIRRSVIIDGVTTTPDVRTTKPAAGSTEPAPLEPQPIQPEVMASPATAEPATEPAAAPPLTTVSEPTPQPTPADAPTAVGPMASLPSTPSANVTPHAIASEAIEDLSDVPIIDRGTSHGQGTAPPHDATRVNPMRSSNAGVPRQEFATEGIDSVPATEATTPSTPAAEPLGNTTPSPVSQTNETTNETPTESPTAAPSESSTEDAAATESPAVNESPAASPARGAARGAEPSLETADTLFSSESPALSFSTHGPRTIVVGKPATYLVRMNNGGGVAAEGVDVKVQIPAWADVLKTRSTAGTSRQEPAEDERSVVRWQLEQIAAQRGETLEITLVPRSSQPFELGVGWTLAPSRNQTQIQVQEPRLELSVLGPREVLYGEKKVYTLTVSNPGTGEAENVTLQLLPIIPTERTGATRKLGTLAPGAREVIELELTARQAGTLEVKAIAAADGNLQVTAAQEVLVRRANLEVAVDGPEKNFAGTPNRYTIKITNSGDASASDVVTAVKLPAGAREVAASRGGRWDESQGMVHWQVGPLRAGESKTLQLQCEFMSAGENRVEARVNGAGELTATHSYLTAIESLADLKLTVNDPKGVVAIGADSLYEIRITNRGTRAAEGIHLVGYFSEGIEPISIDGWRGQIEEGQVVLQPIRKLQAGQEMVVKIIARASKEANHVFRAELDCADPETRLATEEWTRYMGHVRPNDQAEGMLDGVGGREELKVRR